MMCTRRLTAHLLLCLPTALWKRDGSPVGNTHTHCFLFPLRVFYQPSHSLLCSKWPCPIFEALLKLMILDFGNSFKRMKDYNIENNSQMFPFLLRTEFGLLPFKPEREYILSGHQGRWQWWENHRRFREEKDWNLRKLCFMKEVLLYEIWV